VEWNVIGAELALSKTIVDIFAMEDPYDEAASLNRLIRLIGTLEHAQAYFFAPAYSRALEVLASDLPRWREATDVAARFDLYEVSETLAAQVLKHPDPHQLATLAYLIANPAVPPDVISQFNSARSLIPLTRSLSRMLEIRVSLDLQPSNDLERAVSIQSWPGRHPIADLQNLAPTVYLAEQSATAADILKTSAQLIDAGARIRRIPESWNRTVPAAWISDVWPLVEWSGAASTKLRSTLPSFHPTPVLVSETPSGSLAVARLLSKIDSRLPPRAKLRRFDTISGVRLKAFSPETLRLGAFDASEMAYLGAATRSVVQRVSKQSLTPRDADVHRWAFDQLVALRVFQAFKASGRQFKGSPRLIQQQLADISVASEKHRVGLDSSGEFYIEENGVFRSMKGQAAFQDVLAMDDAFRPITMGGGNFPDLLNPSRFTTVHPAVLCGTPAVSEHRVSARAIAEMFETQGESVVRSAYPELSPFEIQDARVVGSGIIAALQ
jgi:uncharacterized protein (DUF433 family)